MVSKNELLNAAGACRKKNKVLKRHPLFKELTIQLPSQKIQSGLSNCEGYMFTENLKFLNIEKWK